MLAKVLSWDRATLQTLPRDIPAELALLEIREHAIVARILQNTLFCKAYSYPFDLTHCLQLSHRVVSGGAPHAAGLRRRPI